MVASFPDSIVAFRGPLSDAWRALGHDVLVAAPGLDPASPVTAELQSRGVRVANLDLQRTGRNPFADLRTLLQLIADKRRQLAS